MIQSEDYHPFENDKMVYPDIFIEDIDIVNVEEVVRPLLDGMWNAYGYNNSPVLE